MAIYPVQLDDEPRPWSLNSLPYFQSHRQMVRIALGIIATLSGRAAMTNDCISAYQPRPAKYLDIFGQAIDITRIKCGTVHQDLIQHQPHAVEAISALFTIHDGPHKVI